MSHGVALLGAGIFAREAHLPAVLNVPEWTLKAVWSRSEASVNAIQQEAQKRSASPTPYHGDKGLDELLGQQDIQTVILSLTIPHQPDTILKAWKAGKNVISEKPVAKDIETAKQLIQLWENEYRPKSIHWIIAEQYPYDPALVEARKMIEAGEIGELRSFSMTALGYMADDNKFFKTEWRAKPDYQGGFLLDGGVHSAAGLRYILQGAGIELKSVSAVASLIQSHLPPHDTLHGVLRTSKPTVSGTFDMSHGHEQRGGREYVFRGSKGNIVCPINEGVKLFQDSKEVKSFPGFDFAKGNLPVNEEFKHFAKAIQDGLDSPAGKDIYERSGPRAALKDVEFIEGALKSSESSSWYPLDA